MPCKSKLKIDTYLNTCYNQNVRRAPSEKLFIPRGYENVKIRRLV